MMTYPDFANKELAAKFDHYPQAARQMLFTIRDWIFDIAHNDATIGALDESLKWGEPAWRAKSGSGITIRADWKAKSPEHVMVFFDCKTDLIDRTRSLLSADLTCEGNRAIILPCDQKLPEQALKTELGWALTYHRDRKATGSA